MFDNNFGKCGPVFKILHQLIHEKILKWRSFLRYSVHVVPGYNIFQTATNIWLQLAVTVVHSLTAALDQLRVVASSTVHIE